MMPIDLSRLSKNELSRLFGDIVARPGDFTEQDLDDIAAINFELLRRDKLKCKTN